MSNEIKFRWIVNGKLKLLLTTGRGLATIDNGACRLIAPFFVSDSYHNDCDEKTMGICWTVVMR